MGIAANEIQYESALDEIFVNLKEINRSPSRRWKLIWAVVFVASAIICASNLVLVTIDFFSFGVTTATRETFHPQLDFPRITICSKNWLRWDRFFADFPPETQDWIRAHFWKSYSPDLIKDLVPAKERYMNWSGGVPMDMRGFLKDYAFNCSEMFPYCGAGLRGGSGCCKFATTFYYRNRMCHSFKFPFSQEKDGADAGFMIYIRQQKPKDGHCSFEEDILQPFCSIEIHLTDKDHDLSISNANYLFISDNYVSIQIHKSVVVTLPHPYGICGDQDPSPFRKYDKGLCYAIRQLTHGLRKCKCAPLDHMMHRQGEFTDPVCDPIENCRCFFESQALKPVNCPQSCRQTFFTVKTSVAQGRFPRFSANYKNNSKVDETILHFHFDRLTVSEVRENPAIPWADYISKIGAILALWLGLRFISFLQFLYFSFWAIRRFKRSRKIDSETGTMRNGRPPASTQNATSHV